MSCGTEFEVIMNVSRVGERNARVVLLSQKQTPDGQGGFKKEPLKPFATVWAKILVPKFWEGNSGGSPASAITQGITIRRRNDVERSVKVKYRDCTYEILHIDYSVPEEMTLTCKAVVHRG